MKQVIWVLVLVSLGSAWASVLTLPEAWQNWKYLNPIELEQTTEVRLAQVPVTKEVFGHALESFDDVRVTNQDFEEVPFQLLATATQQNRTWLGGELKEVSFVPGEYTHLLVDTGESTSFHNRIALELDVSEYFAWVEVAAGDDGETWEILREHAPIYRFPNEGMSSFTLSYPDTRARWLRLRILEGEQALRVLECRVAREQIDRPRFFDWPMSLTLLPPESDPKTGNSTWEVDAEVGNIPVSAVRFEADQPVFHRPVRVSSSRDGKSWREVAWGDIYRHSSASEDEEKETQSSSMRVEFPAARGRYWRVTALNRSDAPVEGLSPILQTNSYRVFFRQEPGASYWLLYGNIEAKKPSYDLSHLNNREDLQRAVSASLGQEEVNSSYLSPEPWTERHPEVLWIALLSAVAILGLLARRTLRSA